MKIIKNTSAMFYLVSLMIIVIDIALAFMSAEMLRMIIGYVAFPATAVFAILKKHKSYWILFTYELLVSLLILNDILGTSVFTYFYLPDIWQLLNTFTITPEIFGLPGFLQPIIIFVGVSFLALIAKFAYQQKSGEKK